MKLRLISGTLKGRYISTGDVGINYRPTQERVRESVEKIKKKRVRGAAIADLCAGSGAYGFEMLSRGAARVDFVEADRRAALRISENAAALGIGGRARVAVEDVRKFVDNRIKSIDGNRRISGDSGLYDIIFYDPPYGDAELAEMAPKLLALAEPGGILVYERRRARTEKKAADAAEKANIFDARVYSDTAVEFYKREKDADSDIPGDL
jgi:16S rRNA (guanine966-N2)-methyltransferase